MRQTPPRFSALPRPTYLPLPQEKPFVARFNRTLQKRSLIFHLHLPFANLDPCHLKLARFLILTSTQLPRNARDLNPPTRAFGQSPNLCSPLDRRER